MEFQMAQTEKKRKQSEENLPREGVSSEDYNSEDSDASFGQSKLGKKRNSKPSLKMKEILFSKLASKVFEQTRSSGASDEMIDEDNTTNSENSEGNNLFSEINWEENIEVDASDLIDEFAPRLTSKDVKTEEPEPDPKEELAPDQRSMEAKIKEEYKEKIELNGKLDTEILEQEFKPGLKLYVMDYKCSTWNEATIAEVDWEENEVLVQYGDSTKSEEWVAMSSQRLSRLIPDNSQIPTRPTITYQTSEIVIKPTEGQQEDKDVYKKRVKKSHIRSSLKNMKSLNKKALKRSNMPREQIAKLESAVSPKHKGKFQVGEKVLAKWSEHRMQKFPAIIKKMAGQGSYDVLFYDGFEKTISEDHLYKTTEEESAKYRHSNPSEADSFVDMDADSKEARRQRKKKTFDDYVFVKDLQKKQRKQEGFAMKKHYFKSKDISGMKSKSSLKKKKKLLLFESENSQQGRTEEFQDYPITSTPIKQDLALVHEPQPENKINPEDDRWSCDISVTARPINMPGPLEGTSFRTVIIPDKQLSNGWIKHAVQLNEEWKVFLISPDKYKVNSIEDLKDYFGRLHKSFQRNLDFTYPPHLLPMLIEKQRELEAINEVFPNWIIRKKIGKKHGTVKSPLKTIHPLSSVNKVGKVRTLLPKYRVEPSSSSPAPTPPTETVPSEGDNVWKCVKEGCEKKFRKESLLQMHIKHYHVEFESLVGAAPNVVDLALARSEIANSDPGPSKSPFPVKRIPSTSVKSEHDSIVQTIAPQMPQSSPVMPRQERNENLVPKRPYQPLEDKKPTIKTIFPFSQSSSLDSSSRLNFESDDFESDEEKLFKPQHKYKKPKPSAMKDETISRPEPTYPVAPGLRYIKKKIAVIDKQQVGTDSNDSYTEEEKVSPSIEMMDGSIQLERLKSEEIINCTCGYREEDGLMIQCDICLCWQHGHCNGIEMDSEVPDQYVCYICRYPAKVRASKKYSYAIHYLTQGKLPSFSFRTKNERDIKQRESVLKKCYEISQRLHEIKNVDQSLRVKINIAEQPDHPKHYLWAKSWSEKNFNGVEKTERGSLSDNQTEEKSPDHENKLGNRVPVPPEAQIDTAECRLRLLEHVDDYLQSMDDRLTSLQTQIAALESQDIDLSSNISSDKLTKQTIQMLLRDLKSVQKLAAIS